jgi:hypothetical protein
MVRLLCLKPFRSLQLLRFDRPVAQVNVTSKPAVDAVLAFSPQDWAVDYTGMWLSPIALLVTVLAVPAGARSSPVARSSTAVGVLRVAVLPSGGVVSADGTSVPSDASTLVTSGSWGDVVCDGGLIVYSHKAVVVAFLPPVNTTHVPAHYTLSASSSPTFPVGPFTRILTVAAAQSASSSDIALPTGLPATSLRFVVPHLTPGEAIYVRVAASVPPLPVDIASVLPRAVAPLAWPLGGLGGCSCAAVTAGAGCGDAPGEDQAVVPSRPVIGMRRATACALFCELIGECQGCIYRT